MSADDDFQNALVAAEKAHRAAKCRCGAKARITRDAMSLETMMAAFRVAEALAEEFDAPPEKIAEAAAKTVSALGNYRRIRRGE